MMFAPLERGEENLGPEHTALHGSIKGGAKHHKQKTMMGTEDGDWAKRV